MEQNRCRLYKQKRGEPSLVIVFYGTIPLNQQSASKKRHDANGHFAQECENAVYEALMTGYRLIDRAAGYLNEEAVGRAIQHSGIPREEIISTCT